MKSIRISEFGPPSVLKLINNLEIPKPAENEVLIKINSVGVNPVDTYRRSGNFRNLPTLPWTPGSDSAGTIVEFGKMTKSNKFVVGERVYTSSTVTGAYSSHAVVPVAHLHKLSDCLSFQQGAGIGVPYFTAYNALFLRGKGCAGETVMIHGASGGVGVACIQLAKANGLKVIGTAGSEEGMKMIQSQGADSVFNHKKSGYLDEIQKQYSGKINLIIEMLANINLVNDCNLAAIRGRIMIVGNRGSIEFDPRLLMGKILELRGVSLFLNSEAEWHETSSEINKLINKGMIKPFIGKEYKLEEASQAHEDIINNAGSLGKMILNVV